MAAVEAGAGTLEFRVLGPLEVCRAGRPLRLGGGRQRGLLALLVLNANEVVSAERLIHDLYGGDPSGTAANALQAIVSRLRRTLDDDATQSVLVTRAPGYVLRVAPAQVDIAMFERLAEDGRGALARGDPGRAAVVLREALALWRGSPLADVQALDAVQPEVRRLEELRLAALMDRIDADLAAGPGRELVAELEALVALNPLQERLRGQLMLALYRAGRQADALAVYRETRGFLREELGLEPSRALQQLERAILGHAAELGPVVGSVERDPAVVCPYKGLAVFEVGDAEFFSGRERVVADVISRLAASSLVGIVGPSGVGKSSILRAGVLKRLSLGVLPGSDRWRLAVLRPGVHPPAELASVLGGGLGELRVDERLVVAVDQLEEAFTLCADEAERAELFGALAELARDAARRALVVVTLRADFYGRCARYPAFAELLSRSHVLVGPMERHELVRAIELPAGRAGLQVERELVDALVADVVDEPGGLPLLSTTMLELWSVREGQVLRFDAYRGSGGMRGAVARMAEAAYAELSEAQQVEARTIFLRLSLGEGEALVRRRVTLEELESGLIPVVERLAAARLLTIRGDTVEVAHEALLREWPRLRRWLDEDRDGRRVQAHLAAAARDWDERGRDRGDLYRGARLSTALEWSAAHERETAPLEREFVAAARRAAEGATRRLRMGIAVLASLLVAAVVAGALALVSRSHARHEATVALAQQLGAEAVDEPRLDRAMLLARESVNLDPSPATDSTLLATLLRSPAAIGTFALPITDRPQNVRVSTDGRTIVVLTNQGVARFYDTRTHRQVHVMPAFANDFTYLPGTNRLLVLAPDGPSIDYELVDGTTYRVLRRFELDRRVLTSPTTPRSPVTVSRDGRYLYFGYAVANPDGSDGAAYVDRWATALGGRPTTIALHERGMIALAAIAGSRLVVATDGVVSTRDARTLRALHSVRTAATGAPAAAISPDGRVFAYGLADGTVHFVDTVTGRHTAGETAHTAGVGSVAFSPDSRTAVSGGDDGLAIVWAPRTGRPVARLSGHVNAIHDLAFDRRGATLYTSSLDGTILQWDLRSRRRFGAPFIVGAWPPTTEAPPTLAVAPDGRSFVALAGPSSLALYSTTSLRLQRTIALPRGHHPTAVAWAGDDIVIGDGTGAVGVYSTGGKPTLVRALAGLRAPIASLAADTAGAVAAVAVHSTPTGRASASLAIWNRDSLVRAPLALGVLRHPAGRRPRFLAGRLAARRRATHRSCLRRRPAKRACRPVDPAGHERHRDLGCLRTRRHARDRLVERSPHALEPPHRPPHRPPDARLVRRRQHGRIRSGRKHPRHDRRRAETLVGHDAAATRRGVPRTGDDMGTRRLHAGRPLPHRRHRRRLRLPLAGDSSRLGSTRLRSCRPRLHTRGMVTIRRRPALRTRLPAPLDPRPHRRAERERCRAGPAPGRPPASQAESERQRMLIAMMQRSYAAIAVTIIERTATVKALASPR
jgi:DNA-binding SARP family transcriptional activator/WD40 repeat protein